MSGIARDLGLDTHERRLSRDSLIVDLRAADLSGIDNQSLIELANLIASASSQSDCDHFRAAVVTQDNLTKGLVNVVRGHALAAMSELEMMIFPREEEAIEWLSQIPCLLEVE